ncbi:MAG TPA: hypothetical protein VFS02_25190 [Telluria sp.]|nr:hypothetical protein [Telluria sp.]
MDEPVAARFSTHLEFGARLRECIARSHASLQLFDPDFRVFPLGQADVDAALRRFLAGGGAMQLAMHRSDHIAREYPRFVRLLKDYSHRIECRATPASLHQLTDSFCIGDGVHIVRRFHSDHMRGEAAFDAAPATEISVERFGAIWLESRPCLHPTTTGL